MTTLFQVPFYILCWSISPCTYWLVNLSVPLEVKRVMISFIYLKVSKLILLFKIDISMRSGIITKSSIDSVMHFVCSFSFSFSLCWHNGKVSSFCIAISFLCLCGLVCYENFSFYADWTSWLALCTMFLLYMISLQ